MFNHDRKWQRAADIDAPWAYFAKTASKNELMSRIAGSQMVWKCEGMPCEHLAAYQSNLGCFWSAKRPVPSAFSAAKRVSVAQTSSWKVPPNGPKTLLKCIPAVARRCSHFTAKTGVMHCWLDWVQSNFDRKLCHGRFYWLEKRFPARELVLRSPWVSQKKLGKI